MNEQPKSTGSEQETSPKTEKSADKVSSQKIGELGIERIPDVEKAYHMATIENLAHAQADAYEDYLKKPEAHLQTHKIQFELFKSEKLSPEDIKRKGEDLGEFFGETYDVDKKIEELIEKKSRTRLLTQAVFGGVKMAVYGLKMSCYDMPRVVLKAFQKKDGSILLNDRELNITDGKAFVGAYQITAALEGLFKINKENNKESKWKVLVTFPFGEDDEIRERAEQYAIPKIRFQDDQVHAKDREEDSSKNDSNESNPDSDKSYSQSKKEKSQDYNPDNNSELSDKVSDKIYEWLENKYVEYLKTGKAPLGFSDIFSTFKSKNLKPEDINQESKHMKTWIGSLSQWRRKFDTLVDENKIKEEQGLNFLDLIFRLLSKNENLSGTDKARSIVTPFIKMFLAGKKLKDITTVPSSSTTATP